MSTDERRRAIRRPVDMAGVMFLSNGRIVEVRIKNVGGLGALVQIGDLEEPVFEGERAVLEHPVIGADGEQAESVRSTGSIVRVELEFLNEGVARQLAMYFDGGAVPEGYEE